MSKIFVSGLANLETSCAVRGFPIDYFPVDYNFDGVSACASGVGLNVSLALTALGDEVTFCSFAGDDPAGEIVRAAAAPISERRFAPCACTPQSVILYDPDGRRAAYTDLKDMTRIRLPEAYYCDPEAFDAFCLCNINYSADVISAARGAGKPVCCDVHCLERADDDYNAVFMAAADVLFFSADLLKGDACDFIRELAKRYPCRIIVAGMGARGSLLYERGCDSFVPVSAVYTRPVVNTVGAGDALFSAFVHFYIKGEPPEKALRLATTFASYKIGESGGAKGFLNESELLRLQTRELQP